MRDRLTGSQTESGKTAGEVKIVFMASWQCVKYNTWRQSSCKVSMEDVPVYTWRSSCSSKATSPSFICQTPSSPTSASCCRASSKRVFPALWSVWPPGVTGPADPIQTPPCAGEDGRCCWGGGSEGPDVCSTSKHVSLISRSRSDSVVGLHFWPKTFSIQSRQIPSSPISSHTIQKARIVNGRALRKFKCLPLYFKSKRSTQKPCVESYCCGFTFGRFWHGFGKQFRNLDLNSDRIRNSVQWYLITKRWERAQERRNRWTAGGEQ